MRVVEIRDTGSRENPIEVHAGKGEGGEGRGLELTSGGQIHIRAAFFGQHLGARRQGGFLGFGRGSQGSAEVSVSAIFHHPAGVLEEGQTQYGQHKDEGRDKGKSGMETGATHRPT